MANDYENGVWRTVGGRRIFIRDGEDLASAMKKSGKFTSKKDIEHQKKKLANDVEKSMFTSEREREEKWKEYDAYDKLSKMSDEELKEKYMDIPEEERVKAYEEGKNWKDLVKEKDIDQRAKKKHDDIMNMDPREWDKRAELAKKAAIVQRNADEGKPLNYGLDKGAEVRSQQSELEKASGSKVKEVFETDLYGNGKEDRFILEDGTIIGHTREAFGQKRDDWYVGDKRFKSYDEVKKYLSGGSDSSKDEHIKKLFDKLYGVDKMDKVSREEFLNDLKDKNRIAQSDYDSLQRTYGFKSKNESNDYDRFTEQTKKDMIEYHRRKVEEYRNTKDPAFADIKEERAREHERELNKAYKSAYQDYKKKHPNSKITLDKFIDMSEGK